MPEPPYTHGRAVIAELADFVRNARAASRGRTDHRPAGEAQIVARLGRPTTVVAADVDIVTEFGIARLRHADVGEHARRLMPSLIPTIARPLAPAVRRLALGA